MKKSNIKTLIYICDRRETAKAMNVSPSTLDYWVKRGFCSPTKINDLVKYAISKHCIITREDLQNDIKENKK